jgi:hypothetical protein
VKPELGQCRPQRGQRQRPRLKAHPGRHLGPTLLHALADWLCCAADWPAPAAACGAAEAADGELAALGCRPDGAPAGAVVAGAGGASRVGMTTPWLTRTLAGAEPDSSTSSPAA